MKKRRLRCTVFRILVLVTALVTGFTACKDETVITKKEHDPKKPIVLTTYRPTEGGVREKVLLDGENFGSDPSKIKVFFNNKEAPVISSNGDRIYAMVPRLPGEICEVKIVVGEQSATYDKTFAYHSVASVTTITGNGTAEFRGGTLAQGQVKARYICVDAESNIFASHREETNRVFVRINESENVVEALFTSVGATLTPNAPAVDFATGIVTVPDDGVREKYYTFDPKEGWAPREKRIDNTNDIFSIIDGGEQRYKYAMSYCSYDNHVYVRYRDGNIVRFNPDTRESEIVYKTNLGPSYGLCFSTIEPWMLYMSFQSSVSEYGNNICTLDVRDGTFKVISSGLGAGHVDGPVEKTRFRDIWQMCFDPEGNLFIGDAGNHCIRMLSPEGIVETVVGQPGVSGYQDGGKLDALFNEPRGVAVDAEGTIFISDFNNARIRKLTIE